MQAILVAIIVGLLVFGGVVGLLTLLNTSTTVTQEGRTQKNLQTDVNVVAGFGSGLEWQLGILCKANHTLCTISPPGPPPAPRTRLKG